MEQGREDVTIKYIIHAFFNCRYVRVCLLMLYLQYTSSRRLSVDLVHTNHNKKPQTRTEYFHMLLTDVSYHFL